MPLKIGRLIQIRVELRQCRSQSPSKRCSGPLGHVATFIRDVTLNAQSMQSDKLQHQNEEALLVETYEGIAAVG